MSHECKITTFDNPYDPFEEFDSWFSFDVEKGYDTCKYLATVAHITDDMSEKEEDEENERAIDSIIDNDFLNIYKKVVRELPEIEDEENDLSEDEELTPSTT